jgi:lipopolysaccharide export system protein LptC
VSPVTRVPGLMLGIALAGAAPSTQVVGPYYTLETTVLRYNTGSGAFVADAPVRITKPRLAAAADKADGNAKTGAASLRGSVQVHDEGGPRSPQGKNAAPATLTCDQLDLDGKRDTYHAEGHAHYESADRTATAQTMVLDRKRKTLHLEGDVVLTQGSSTAHAAVVDVDLASGRTVSTGAPVILSQPASPNPRPAPSPSPQ